MKRKLTHCVIPACLASLSMVPLILAMVSCKQEEETIPPPIKPPAEGPIQPQAAPGSGGEKQTPSQNTAPQGQTTRR